MTGVEMAGKQAERVRYLLEETARYRRYLQTAALPTFPLVSTTPSPG